MEAEVKLWMTVSLQVLGNRSDTLRDGCNRCNRDTFPREMIIAHRAASFKWEVRLTRNKINAIKTLCASFLTSHSPRLSHFTLACMLTGDLHVVTLESHRRFELSGFPAFPVYSDDQCGGECTVPASAVNKYLDNRLRIVGVARILWSDFK